MLVVKDLLVVRVCCTVILTKFYHFGLHRSPPKIQARRLVLVGVSNVKEQVFCPMCVTCFYFCL